MSPRPKNPPPDRRGEILDAALRVFSRKGYAAATNAEIAREAGVTAAALYYYFPSKGDLFKAAVSERQAQVMPVLDQMRQMRDLPPEQVLPMVMEYMIRFMSEEKTRSIIAILLAEGPRNPELLEIWLSQIVGPMFPILIGYIQHQMDRGAIRQMDPRVIQMLIVGPVITTILTRDLLRAPLMQELTNETLAREMARTLLPGLLHQHDEPAKE